MVTVCLHCGDKGFSNALVYCVMCLQVAVHRYCLDELPTSFDEFVHWVCDDCEVEGPQQFVSLNSKPVQDYTDSEHVKASSHKKLKKRRTINVVLDDAEDICEDVLSEKSHKVDAEDICEDVLSEKSHKVDAEIELTGRAQLVCEETCGGATPITKTKDQISPRISSPQIDVICEETCGGATPITKTKDQISPRIFSPQVDVTNNEVGSHHSQCLGDYVTLRKKNSREKNKDKTVRQLSSEKLKGRHGYKPYERPSVAYTGNKFNGQDTLTELEEVASPFEGENNKKNKKNKESARRLLLSETLIQKNGYSPLNTSNEHKETRELEKKKDSLSEATMEWSGRQSCEMNSELDVTLNGYGRHHLLDNVILYSRELAQPLADPIWRGSFNILNKDFDAFEGMVAHLSRKACPRAYEEARMFPTLLNVEMHPKLDVWPKSFEISEPSGDSIALYFFPSHKRYERMFDDLVEEMLSHTLAMRAVLENAELLVFTSTELPLNYWRFQGKYYLWGVFRAKRPPSAQPAINNHVESSCNILSNRRGSSARDIDVIQAWRQGVEEYAEMSNAGMQLLRLLNGVLTVGTRG